MVFVEKQDDGLLLLASERDKFQKFARLKGGSKKVFFVSWAGAFAYLKGKRKNYKYGKVSIGQNEIRMPNKLIGKRVRFVCQVENDIGEWE